MIHLITLNPAIDHFINSGDVQMGKTNYVTSDYIVFGGKAINVAHVLSELDVNCRLITTTDNIYNQFITESLGCIDQYLIEVDSVRINTKLNVDGTITELNSRGQSLKGHYDKFQNYINKYVKANDYVLIAGNPHPEDYDFMIELCEMAKNITENIIIDTSKITLSDLERIKPLLIKPNDEEIASLFAQKDVSMQMLKQSATLLMEKGISQVAITLGKDGSIYFNSHEQYEIPVLNGVVVNTVGAGDSFVAGMIYGLNNKLSTSEQLKYATACASATAFSEGLAKKNDITHYYQKVKVKEL